MTQTQINELDAALKSILGHESLVIANNGTVFENKEKPLTQKGAEQIALQTASLFDMGETHKALSMKVLGNIAHVLSKTDYPLDTFIKTTGYSYAVVSAAQRTFEFFIDGWFDVSYTHHKEIAHMRNLSDEWKMFLIEMAEAEEWSVAAMRKGAATLKRSLKELNRAISDDEAKEILSHKDEPTRKLKTYLVITPLGRTAVFESTDEPQREPDTACYEINRIIWENEYDGRGAGNNQAAVEEIPRAATPD